jgi:hypothetical protein
MSQEAATNTPTDGNAEATTMTPTELLAKGAGLSVTEYKALQVERARIAIMCSARNL